MAGHGRAWRSGLQPRARRSGSENESHHVPMPQPCSRPLRGGGLHRDELFKGEASRDAQTRARCPPARLPAALSLPSSPRRPAPVCPSVCPRRCSSLAGPCLRQTASPAPSALHRQRTTRTAGHEGASPAPVVVRASDLRPLSPTAHPLVTTHHLHPPFTLLQSILTRCNPIPTCPRFPAVLFTTSASVLLASASATRPPQPSPATLHCCSPISCPPHHTTTPTPSSTHTLTTTASLRSPRRRAHHNDPDSRSEPSAP